MSRKNRRKEPERRLPVVSGLLISMNTAVDYKARYDCPWCGMEHEVQLHVLPPVEIMACCGQMIILRKVLES